VTGGLTRVGTDPVQSPPGTGFNVFNITKINMDAATVTAGFQIGRSLGTLTPFLRAQLEVYFIGANLGSLRGIDEDIGESGPLVGIPVQFGVRIGL
jgi:hypothetical protein